MLTVRLSGLELEALFSSLCKCGDKVRSEIFDEEANNEVSITGDDEKISVSISCVKPHIE